ncbi:hypothetical protein DWZ63_10180 [Clostridium sp. AF34-13]|uniref:hypothetical protein n=1 Tax=Clostridium sp. AF34-13 TaxID=2293012 RepID=UPI000E470275|nr:hypothetical protein [Clostridium sp. AF34-13]RHP24318.1 hypothetical protein DWZ63_10180 [Clostridium sp. AF34-13]
MFNGNFFSPQTFSLSEILPNSDLEAIKNYNAEFDRLKNIVSKYPAQINDATIAQKACNDTLINASDKVKILQANANGGKIAIDGLTKASKAAELGMKALSTAGNMIVNMGIAFAVTSLISGIVSLINKENDLLNKAKELGEELNSSTTDIDSYKDKIDKLKDVINDSSSSIDDVADAREQLMTIQDEIIEKYGDEANVIDIVTESINGQTSALDELKRAKYEEAKDKYNEEDLGDKVGNFFQSFIDGHKALFNVVMGNDINEGIDQAKTKLKSMIEEMEGQQVTIPLTTNSKIDDMIEASGFAKTKDGFTILGSAHDVQSQLNDLKNLTSKYDLSDTDFSSTLNDEISSIKTLIDKNDKLYQQSILYEKVLNQTGDNYKEQYNTLKDTAKKYNEAKISGNKNSIKQASEEFSNALDNATKTATKNDDFDVAEYFKNLYPTIQKEVSSWSFSVDFKANTDNLKTNVNDALSKLKGLSTQDLLHFNAKTATDSQIQGYGELINYANTYNMSIENLIKLLQKLGLVQPKAYQELVNKFGKAKVNKLSKKDLEIAYTIPNVSLLSWDELLKKIKQVKKEASKQKNISQSFNSAWGELDDSTKNSLLELAEAGNLTKETFLKVEGSSDFLTKLGLSEKDIDKVINKINKLVDNSKQLSTMRSGISSITSAYDEKKDSKYNTVSASTLSSMYDTLGIKEWDKENIKAWENYKEIAGDSAQSLSSLAKAQNKLASAYVNSHDFLSGLTKETQDYYEAQLTEMGVTNAHEVTTQVLANKMQYLAEQKAYAKKEGEELSKASTKNLKNFIDEQGGANKVSAALFNLAVNKEMVNNHALNFDGDVSNLLSYVEAIEGANKALNALKALKAIQHGDNDTAAKLGYHYMDTSSMSKLVGDAKKEVNKAKNKLKTNTTKVNPTVSLGNKNNSSKDSSNKSKSKDKTKPTAQIFDFIERRINKLTKTIDYAKAKIEALFTVKAKNSQLDTALKNTTNLVNAQKKAANKYQAYADKLAKNATKGKKGLRQSEVNKYIKLIKNGSLTKDAIKSIKNEKLKTFIENYQTYYDKAQEAKKAVQENITSIVELNKQKLDNITSHYDTLISKIEATTSKLEAQLSVQKAVNSLYNNGETGSASTYKNLLTSSSSEINKYIAEKKAYDKERKSARKQLNNSLKKSGVSKSQRKSALADFDATTKAQIDNFNTSIFNAESKLYEYAQSLASLPWDKATAKIEKLSTTYDILQAKLSNGTSVNGKNKILDKINDNLDDQLSEKKSALKKDKQNVKSSALWINKNSKIKVTAGKLLTKDQLSAIKGIYGKDSKQYKEAVKYNSYVKALQNNQADYNKSVEENKTNKAENFKTQFTNIQTGFERSISDIEAKSDHIENVISILEAKGYKANASYYEKLAQISGETITKNTDDLTALKNKLQEGLDNGTIQVGTDSYYEMVDAISSVEKNIDASTLSQEQFLQKVRETNAELKEHARTAISDLNDEAEFYQDILSYKDAYDDNGNMTDAGKSRLGLSLTKMSNDIALNNKYNEAIAELDASYAKHEIGYDEYYTKRKELVSQQRESIKNYYSETDAIKSLIEEGYNAQKDALSDLISKYTDALDAAKNLHDYEKSIKEKTENIDSIKKRIAALQGNDTEEARQKIQKLNIDLKKAKEDLDETQYEQYINDQKDILNEMQNDYEKFVEEQLKDVDDLIRKLIEGAKGNTQDVLKVLESLANKWDIDLSAILKNDMEKGDFSSVDNKDSNAVDNANKHYDEDKKNEEYNPPAPDDNKSNNEDSKNTETKKTLTDILKEIADENANETTHQIHGVEGKDQNGNMWYNRLSTDKINQLVYDKTGNVIEDSALMDLAKKLGVEIPKGLTKEMLYSSLDKQPKLAQEFRDALFEKLQDMDFSTDIETLLSGFTTSIKTPSTSDIIKAEEDKVAAPGETNAYAEQAKAEAERQSKENETKYLKKILNNLTGSANDTNKPLRKIKPGETSKSALNKKLSADYGVVVKSGTGNHGQKYIDMFAKAIGLIGGDGYGENDEVYQKLKKEYPHLGFSTGGVVGQLNKVATDNGDDGWITVQAKERVLTVRQNNLWEKWTKNLPELVNIADYLPSMSEYMPKIPDMATNMQVQNVGNSVNVGDISYTMEFPNVTDPASMKEAIKQDTSLQNLMRDVTIGQMKKGNKLGMMKY